MSLETLKNELIHLMQDSSIEIKPTAGLGEEERRLMIQRASVDSFHDSNTLIYITSVKNPFFRYMEKKGKLQGSCVVGSQTVFLYSI